MTGAPAWSPASALLSQAIAGAHAEARSRGQELHVLGEHQARRERDAATSAWLELARQHRIGQQRDVGHGAAELGQAARHVIARGDDDEPAEAWQPGPGLGLLGIAAGVVGLVADIDAAIEQAAFKPLLRFRSSRLVDGVGAGDQQPLAALVGQQSRRLDQTMLAAGQHDDAVGRARRSWRPVRDTVANTTKPARNTANQYARGHG